MGYSIYKIWLILMETVFIKTNKKNNTVTIYSNFSHVLVMKYTRYKLAYTNIL